MKIHLRFLLYIVILGILLVGCINNSLNQQLRFLNTPTQITLGESFAISGKYVGDSSNIEVQLIIYQIDGEILYRDSKDIYEKSEFEFEEIIIDQANKDIYFELLLFDDSLEAQIDTKSNPVKIHNWHTQITTTYFKPEGLTTWGYPLKDENPFYFALPYRDFYYYVKEIGEDEPQLRRRDYYGVTDVKNRWVEIYYPETDIYVYAQWVDVGPWNYYDPNYVFGTNDERPYAEMGVDMGWLGYYRETNKAGLDISPTAMKYLNNGELRGLINVDWRFLEAERVPNGPWKERISASPANVEVLNLETKSLKTSGEN